MKATIKNIIQEFANDKNYFSFQQLKQYLRSNKFVYADVSLKKALKLLADEELIFSAGRGYYSNIPMELNLDPSPIVSIVQIVKQKFPLLQFSVWGTKQINFAFHHTQNKFFTFIYADRDSLVFLRDHLVEANFPVFLNPFRSDLEKTTFTAENSIILRPFITRSVSIGNYASIEKIIVDLFLESDRLNILDKSEYTRIFEHLLLNYRLNISALLDYAERRKIMTKIKQLLIKYTNPTLV
ncbi:MAG: DUF6577 family protein [Candidatus Doudnabacteria bacterium]